MMVCRLLFHTRNALLLVPCLTFPSRNIAASSTQYYTSRVDVDIMRIIDDDDENLNGPASPSSNVSWVILKEQGKSAFERGDYQCAISKYGLALQPDRNCPAAERQILLSNMVAARLKIGGPAQSEAAVENAKQCVALNDRWAKGHVRLASAYIALGGHSNAACNSLQRALQLDPGYPSARDMLIRELRRGHAEASSQSRANNSDCSGTGHTPPEPSAPPEHFDNQGYSTRTAATDNDRQTQEEQNRRPFNPYQGQQQPPLDDQISLQDRILFSFHRARMWYFSQSDDVQTLLKVLVGILILYVAFGGRFGLEALRGENQPRRGNYHSGNAYDQYYEGQRRTTTSETRRGEYQYQTDNRDNYGRHASRNDHNARNDYSSNNYDENTYSSPQTRGGGGTSFHLPNLFDGSLQSMLILGGIFYLCHRNGVNPMQILFFLNMMNGRRGGFRNRGMFGYGRGMGGMGGGMGGMGGGFGGMGGFGRRRW